MTPYALGYSKCNHEDPEEVFKIGKIKFFLADEDCAFQADGLRGRTLVLNLTGVSHYGGLPIELRSHSMFAFEEIVIKWPDGSFPALQASFWPGLTTYANRKGFDNVIIHCKAGHGRTGTAAACLLVSGLKFTPCQAVDQLREKYCEEVVETQTQTNYLGWVAEQFGIKNDSDLIIPSYHAPVGYAMSNPTSSPSATVAAEKDPVNFDWDSWL